LEMLDSILRDVKYSSSASDSYRAEQKLRAEVSMTFSGAICEHLAEYKRGTLGVIDDGIFRYRGKDIPKPHILPIRERQLNILDRYRLQFFASEYSKIHFHRYFHHLNSSQAMCINLFYPLINENALGLIMRFLDIRRASELRPWFEKESELENTDRRTSFDFHIAHSGENHVFFEIKYTERDFGKAKNDDEHRKKFKTTYLPLLKQSTYLSERCHDESFFLSHYQMLRNLVHLASNAHIVLLFPSANSGVAQQAAEAYDHFLTDAGRSRLKIIFLEGLVSFIEANCSTASLVEYFGQFRDKYLPPFASGSSQTLNRTPLKRAAG
jgi:hypothetical protein